MAHIAVSSIFIATALLPLAINAETPTTGAEPTPSPTCEAGSICLENPLGNISDPRVIVGLVIKVVLGIVGSLAMVIFIYGGLLWMTSSGNSETITKGRNTLLWAVIGLLVVFGSYTLVNFIIRSLPPQ